MTDLVTTEWPLELLRHARGVERLDLRAPLRGPFPLPIVRVPIEGLESESFEGAETGEASTSGDALAADRDQPDHVEGRERSTRQEGADGGPAWFDAATLARRLVIGHRSARVGVDAIASQHGRALRLWWWGPASKRTKNVTVPLHKINELLEAIGAVAREAGVDVVLPVARKERPFDQRPRGEGRWVRGQWVLEERERPARVPGRDLRGGGLRSSGGAHVRETGRISMSTGAHRQETDDER